jgi:hypothetical protein
MNISKSKCSFLVWLKRWQSWDDSFRFGKAFSNSNQVSQAMKGPTDISSFGWRDCGKFRQRNNFPAKFCQQGKVLNVNKSLHCVGLLVQKPKSEFIWRKKKLFENFFSYLDITHSFFHVFKTAAFSPKQSAKIFTNSQQEPTLRS